MYSKWSNGRITVIRNGLFYTLETPLEKECNLSKNDLVRSLLPWVNDQIMLEIINKLDIRLWE